MKTIALVIAGAVQACGWNYQGHLLSAGVAECILTKQAPEVLVEVQDILEALQSNQTRHERDHRFVESALFADLIKREGGEFQANWHFNDLQADTQSRFLYTLLPDDVMGHSRVAFVQRIKHQTEALTVTSALQQAYDTLWCFRHGCTPSNEVYRAVVQHYGNDTDIVQSVVTRLLIHYTGDISQPLHNSNRNDRGGNDFPIKLHYGVDNLHALWDTAIYANHNVSNTPFNQQEWAQFIDKACGLSSQFNFDQTDYEWSPDSTKRWSAESYLEAQSAYSGIAQNKSVSLQYILRHQYSAQRKVALAGYRLAAILFSIYD